MKIQSGDMLKHSTFMDVAIQVNEVLYDRVVLVITAIWVNQGINETFVIDEKPFQITIHEDQRSFWFKCKNPNAKCIRYEQWEQLTGAKIDE